MANNQPRIHSHISDVIASSSVERGSCVETLSFGFGRRERVCVCVCVVFLGIQKKAIIAMIKLWPGMKAE